MDDFLINFGKKVNSFSGFLDGLINFVFRYLSEDSAVMDAIVTTGNYVDIGIHFGGWLKNFFNSEVTSYSKDYTVTTTSTTA
jgi:hypothetical protein